MTTPHDQLADEVERLEAKTRTGSGIEMCDAWQALTELFLENRTAIRSALRLASRAEEIREELGAWAEWFENTNNILSDAELKANAADIRAFLFHTVLKDQS